MGIPSYFSHIVKKYKHIVESMENQDIQYDNLYMDSNSIIYDMLHTMESMQGDDDFETWFQYDVEYIENWNLLLDLKIIFYTIPALLKKDTKGI